jgi:photosystem II stability/assembly factor-like uncharacterized protein
MVRPSAIWPPVTLILLAMLILPQVASAQDGPTRWQALGAPGGNITLLAAASDGETLYAVSVAEVNRNADETQTRERGTPTRSDALYRSAAAGQYWTAVTNDLPPGAINLLFVDRDDTVWAGLQTSTSAAVPQGELWSSLDGGVTWRRAVLDRGDLRLRGMTQEANGDLLLLADGTDGDASGLLYRRSGGVWSGARLTLPGVPSGVTAAQVIAHPSRSRLFLTTTLGYLFLSDDGGLSWTRSGTGEPAALLPPAQLALLADRPSVALLARPTEAGVALERSTDDGDTWATITARGLPVGQTIPGSLVAVGRGALLLTTDRGVYRSADEGKTWQALEGALDSAYIHQILPLPGGNSLVAGTAYGMFASDDRGALWRQVRGGLPANSAVLGLLTHPDRPGQIFAFTRAIGATDASIMLVSRDGGATWLPAGPGGVWTNATAWAIDPRNPDRVHLAGVSFIATSADGGLTWRKQETATRIRRTAIAIAPSNPDRIYVDGAPGLVSDDGGDTWRELPSFAAGGSADIARGVAVDPADPDHVWFGFPDGVRESRDGGQTMQRAGLDGLTVGWLRIVSQTDLPARLFAGIENGGIMRWDAAQGWQPAERGLPTASTILAFAADPQSPGLLWAARDGGGIYGSIDGGDSWQNAGRSVGDNLGLAIAPNYSPEGGWLIGTAIAGVWLLGPERPSAGGTPTPPGPTSSPQDGAARSGADARIEVVWPHNFAPLQEATLANVGIRLFLPHSLEPPSCGWRPAVELWRAVDTEPATRIALAQQRTVDGQPFPYWDANDVDIAPARAEGSKIYFLVKVDGVDTATSVWAHGADARTFFPEQLVPSGIATGVIGEIDARIQIVWPHDENGAGRPVEEAALANVAVTLFKHGTRLSVPPGWRPVGSVRLYGAWNAEVARAFAVTPDVTTRQSGAITFPVWEFNDVPVDRARDAANRLYLWPVVEGVRSYPTIWAHGVDSRTYFPAKDEPVLGCLP